MTGCLGCGKPMQLGMSSCKVSQVLRSTHILLQIGGPRWSFGVFVAKMPWKSRYFGYVAKKSQEIKRVKQYKPRYCLYLPHICTHIIVYIYIWIYSYLCTLGQAISITWCFYWYMDLSISPVHWQSQAVQGFPRSHFESAKQSKVNGPEIEWHICW